MCFEKNPHETLRACENARKTLHRNQHNRLWLPPDLNPNKPVKIKSYIAMDRIEEMSTSAALVWAAEYERRTIKMDEPPPIFDLDKWDPKLLKKFEQIGFFQRFGYEFTTGSNEGVIDDIMTVPFYSGTQAQMEKANEDLVRLVEHIDPSYQLDIEMRLALNSAIGEAANNAREHAHSPDHVFKYPHVERWWATGAASISKREIVICLFDQGVTIPISYPKLPAFSRLKTILNLFDPNPSSPYQNDAVLIQAATEYGKSGRPPETGLGGAKAKKSSAVGGYGLPQIKDAINLCGGGTLIILSRGGRYIYRVDGKNIEEQLDTYDYSIGGTLIEWTVKLPMSGPPQ
ncbi:hypothetical protein [Hyphomonas sp. ND6WE1B]|uniref:hypothetical protein n=1 Tax=Hyphomonas sp. ND6WE1B TaxID=1848191 RepID=UPI00080761B3|nr:hypothetical protein [Hyphomonas sp. ND6WE1B]